MIIDSFLKEAKNKNFPKHWENVDQIASGNNFVSTHQVKKGSQEWQSIEASFKQTMSNATVH